MARTKRQPSQEPTIPAAARPAYDAIVALTDAFCREFLDDEYATLCRKLAGILFAMWRDGTSFEPRKIRTVEPGKIRLVAITPNAA